MNVTEVDDRSTMMNAQGHKRQAVLCKWVLIGFVAIIAISPHATAGAFSPETSKFGGVRLFEGIDITYLSPQINPLIAATDSEFFLFRGFRSRAMEMNASRINDKPWLLYLYRRFLEFISSDVQRIEHSHPTPTANAVSGSRPAIVDFKLEMKPLLRFVGACLRVHPNISAQLPFGRVFSILYQPTSSYIQTDGGKKQKQRDDNKQSIRNLQPIPVERRPELGSLIAALFSVSFGLYVGVKAGDFLYDGRKVAAGLLFFACVLLGISGTVGVLLGFDLWSLWRLL